MGMLIFAQVLADLVFIGVIAYLLIDRSKASRRDDPRLSRGLQLLQNKLAVFQDLMERAETFSSQMTQLLDKKGREVQTHIEEASHHVQKIRESISKSNEVAKIFQDRIPHEEIIERQNTLKYIQAAKLAHAGATLLEIQTQTGLPRGEAELIAKLNKDQLIVDQLPAWAEETPPPSETHPIETKRSLQIETHFEEETTVAPKFSAPATAAPSQAKSNQTQAEAMVELAQTAAQQIFTKRSTYVTAQQKSAGVDAVVANTGAKTTVYPLAFKRIEVSKNS